MAGMKAIWYRAPNDREERPASRVIIVGFGQFQASHTDPARPVAIIQELEGEQRMRYVELKFLELVDKR